MKRRRGSNTNALHLVTGALLALVGCIAVVDTSRYDTNPAPPSNDGGGESSPNGEASSAPITCSDEDPLDVPCGPCDLSTPFGHLTPMTTVNTLNHEFSARLTDDLKTLYLHSAPGLKDQIYIARRASTHEAFGAPAVLEPLATSLQSVRFAMVTGDDLTMVLAAAQATAAGDAGLGFRRDVFFVRRQSTVEPFGVPTLAGVGALGQNDTPWISRDGKTLLFLSIRDNPDDPTRRSLYEAKQMDDASAGGFGQPTKVEVVGMPLVDLPVLSEDGLTLYFGAPNVGEIQPYRLQVAHRSIASGNFIDPKPVKELASITFDWPTWLSADGCTLLISSARSGSSDIFAARKARAVPK